MSRLIYVGDTMCSWCWGFAPEIESLADDHQVEVVVGGLRPGPAAQPLHDRLADFLRRHWLEIAERTGQPFDTSFLDRRDGWVYDTEPAAVAVAAVRDSSPDRALSYFTSVQHAFYAEGRDVTDYSVLAAVAAEEGIDPALGARIRTEEGRKAAWADFSRARSWGIHGFPNLIAELADGRLALVARGWTTADTVRERLQQAIASA